MFWFAARLPVVKDFSDLQHFGGLAVVAESETGEMGLVVRAPVVVRISLPGVIERPDVLLELAKS